MSGRLGAVFCAVCLSLLSVRVRFLRRLGDFHPCRSTTAAPHLTACPRLRNTHHLPPLMSANLASHDPPSFSCGPTVDGTDNVIFLKALPFRLYFRSGQIDPPPSGAKMMALHRASR